MKGRCLIARVGDGVHYHRCLQQGLCLRNLCRLVLLIRTFWFKPSASWFWRQTAYKCETIEYSSRVPKSLRAHIVSINPDEHDAIVVIAPKSYSPSTNCVLESRVLVKLSTSTTTVGASMMDKRESPVNCVLSSSGDWVIAFTK